MAIMPGTTERGIWRWITEYVSPAAAVLTILDAVLAVATTGTAVEALDTIINPFWIYVAAYFSVAIPLSFALAPLAERVSTSTGAWWTRDERLFQSIQGILDELREWETALPDIPGVTHGEEARLDQLSNDLHSRLAALRIRTDVDRSALHTEVVHGTLRRARRL